MTQALQLLLSLSILVILHELGHFIPAKLFKTRVEKFYLFFDPWFSLFKLKKGETEYGIGWLPLGGYVKIAGMIDESMDKEQLKKEPQPWEFRSKPAWQRLIIMIGGVTVNIILAAVIYAMVLFTWGRETLPLENVKYGVMCDSLALKMGIRNGDKIIAVNNKTVNSFNKIPVTIILEKAGSIQIERNGNKLDIPVTADDISQLLRSQKTFLAPRIPCIVDSVILGTGANKAGLITGDKIIAINETKTLFYDEVTDALAKNKSAEIKLEVVRNNDTLQLPVAVSTEGKIGFYTSLDLEKFFTIKKEKFNFFEAIPAGISEGYDKLVMYVKQFGVIFTVKDAHKSVGGFYSLGKAYSPTWDWQVFWSFTAFLSIALAFMNLLPIPALDGGHVMFLIYEIVTGRKPNEKFMEYAQYAGMAILLALMIYANTDFLRSK